MTDHVDREVYDTYQAYEIDKTKKKMLVPLDSIKKKQASDKIFLLNGCKKIVLYNNITIKEIKLEVTYPSISLTINHFMLQQNTIVTSTLNTQVKIINQNLNLRFGHISMIPNNSDITNNEIMVQISYKIN